LIHIKVRRPTVDDRGELFEFFKTVVEDTFIKEGIEGLVGDLKEEMVNYQLIWNIQKLSQV
jgi:hypothetical protein